MKSSTLNEYALKLRKIREQIGCTAVEMASRLSISYNGYNKNENGDNFPSRRTLKILSEKYNISMDWFFFNKGPMYYQEPGEKEIQLEEEVKRLTAELEIAGKGKPTSPEMRELLEYMKQTPIFYHKVMLFFREYQEKAK